MLDNEDLVVLTKAAAWIAERTGGRRPNISTLHRWATRGVRGVTLETVAVGHVRYTSIEAVRRFLAAKPAAPAPVLVVDVAHRRPPACRQRPDGSVGEFERRLFRRGRSPAQEAAP
jgi:DNA helicase HerA-like ATPase